MRTTTLFSLLLCCQFFTTSVGIAQVAITDAMRPFLASQSTVFLLENARIVDGTGAGVVEGMSLLIEDGLISGIGANEDFVIPENAERIDLSDQTILPGLIMMHEHISYADVLWGYGIGVSGQDVIPTSYPDSIAKLLLAAGVTTAREPGAWNPQAKIYFARQISMGVKVGPELSTGPFLNGPDDVWLGDFDVETAEKAREDVRYWARRGASVIKVYTAIGPEALRGAIEEAHRQGIQITGHMGRVSCSEAAALGIDSIEHFLAQCGDDLPEFSETDAGDASDAAFTALIETLVQNDVTVIDTPIEVLTEEALSLLRPGQRAAYDAMLANPPQFIGAFMVNPDPRLRAFVNDLRRRFVAAGGRLLIGTDSPNGGGMHGFSAHSAMIQLADAFSPLEVIRMATSDAAEFLRIDDRTGTVAPGLEADLLVVSGEPDLDINDIRNVTYVFNNGLAYRPERLRDASNQLVGLPQP